MYNQTNVSFSSGLGQAPARLTGQACATSGFIVRRCRCWLSCAVQLYNLLSSQPSLAASVRSTLLSHCPAALPLHHSNLHRTCARSSIRRCFQPLLHRPSSARPSTAVCPPPLSGQEQHQVCQVRVVDTVRSASKSSSTCPGRRRRRAVLQTSSVVVVRHQAIFLPGRVRPPARRQTRRRQGQATNHFQDTAGASQARQTRRPPPPPGFAAPPRAARPGNRQLGPDARRGRPPGRRQPRPDAKQTGIPSTDIRPIRTVNIQGRRQSGHRQGQAARQARQARPPTGFGQVWATRTTDIVRPDRQVNRPARHARPPGPRLITGPLPLPQARCPPSLPPTPRHNNTTTHHQQQQQDTLAARQAPDHWSSSSWTDPPRRQARPARASRRASPAIAAIVVAWPGTGHLVITEAPRRPSPSRPAIGQPRRQTLVPCPPPNRPSYRQLVVVSSALYNSGPPTYCTNSTAAAGRIARHKSSGSLRRLVHRPHRIARPPVPPTTRNAYAVPPYCCCCIAAFTCRIVVGRHPSPDTVIVGLVAPLSTPSRSPYIHRHNRNTYYHRCIAPPPSTCCCCRRRAPRCCRCLPPPQRRRASAVARRPHRRPPFYCRRRIHRSSRTAPSSPIQLSSSSWVIVVAHYTAHTVVPATTAAAAAVLACRPPRCRQQTAAAAPHHRCTVHLPRCRCCCSVFTSPLDILLADHICPFQAAPPPAGALPRRQAPDTRLLCPAQTSRPSLCPVRRRRRPQGWTTACRLVVVIVVRRSLSSRPDQTDVPVPSGPPSCLVAVAAAFAPYPSSSPGHVSRRRRRRRSWPTPIIIAPGTTHTTGPPPLDRLAWTPPRHRRLAAPWPGPDLVVAGHRRLAPVVVSFRRRRRRRPSASSGFWTYILSTCQTVTLSDHVVSFVCQLDPGLVRSSVRSPSLYTGLRTGTLASPGCCPCWPSSDLYSLNPSSGTRRTRPALPCQAAHPASRHTLATTAHRATTARRQTTAWSGSIWVWAWPNWEHQVNRDCRLDRSSSASQAGHTPAHHWPIRRRHAHKQAPTQARRRPSPPPGAHATPGRHYNTRSPARCSTFQVTSFNTGANTRARPSTGQAPAGPARAVLQLARFSTVRPAPGAFPIPSHIRPGRRRRQLRLPGPGQSPCLSGAASRRRCCAGPVACQALLPLLPCALALLTASRAAARPCAVTGPLPPLRYCCPAAASHQVVSLPTLSYITTGRITPSPYIVLFSHISRLDRVAGHQPPSCSTPIANSAIQRTAYTVVDGHPPTSNLSTGTVIVNNRTHTSPPRRARPTLSRRPGHPASASVIVPLSALCFAPSTPSSSSSALAPGQAGRRRPDFRPATIRPPALPALPAARAGRSRRPGQAASLSAAVPLGQGVAFQPGRQVTVVRSACPGQTPSSAGLAGLPGCCRYQRRRRRQARHRVVVRSGCCYHRRRQALPPGRRPGRVRAPVVPARLPIAAWARPDQAGQAALPSDQLRR